MQMGLIPDVMSAPGALDSDSNQSLNSLIIQNLLTPTRIGKLLKYLPMIRHIPKWVKRGLIIKYLPPYSPELNLIEILWRFMKYSWLPFSAYMSFPCLVQAVEDILTRFGTDYTINFQATRV